MVVLSTLLSPLSTPSSHSEVVARSMKSSSEPVENQIGLSARL
jgi:hypothetical protein